MLACLRGFFACSPSLHFYRRLCYAFWIKGVSILITLLKEYTILQPWETVSTRSLSQRSGSLSCPLSLAFIIAFFYASSSSLLHASLRKKQFFVSLLFPLVHRKIFLILKKKFPRVSVSLDSGSAAGECQGLTIYTWCKSSTMSKAFAWPAD